MNTKIKIVVIDDEKDLCQLVKDILEETGKVEVSVAFDGVEGIKICKENVPDLIFLDFVMPKVRGDEILKSLKRDSTTKGIPVVMISGLGEMSYFKKKDKWFWKPNTPVAHNRGEASKWIKKSKSYSDIASDFGVDAYLSKPFSRESLIDILHFVLKEKFKKEEEE